MIHEETTGKILQAFYKVYNTLGFGFLEKVYENALVIELMKLGLEVNNKHRYPFITMRSWSEIILPMS